VGLLSFVISITVISGQAPPQNTDWRSYGADLRNTRYSPLDQIKGDNFGKLEVAWRFKPDNLGPGREFKFESTPLVANGVLYSTAGTRRAVVALDAGNGELLWMHRLDEGKRGAVSPRKLSGRGLAYWTGRKSESSTSRSGTRWSPSMPRPEFPSPVSAPTVSSISSGIWTSRSIR
jgi:glucose dehydrogenase